MIRRFVVSALVVVGAVAVVKSALPTWPAI